MDLCEMRYLFPEEYLAAFLHAGVCPDGRSINGGRKVTLNVGSLTTSDGSSIVRFGNTLVTCGVKLEFVATTPTSLEQAVVCNVEVPPCSSSHIATGPPSSNTQALAQTLQTVMLKCVDVGQLLIDNGKFHWVLYVDVVCLSDDGNLMDSANLAAIAALKTTLLPSVDGSSDLPIVTLKHHTNLVLTATPLFISFALLPGGRSLLDANQSEEKLAMGSITFCFHGNTVMKLTHTGEGISSDKIQSLSKIAQSQAEYLLKLLNVAINKP